MSVIFVFLPKPQLVSALCDIMEVLSYFRQQKGFFCRLGSLEAVAWSLGLIRDWYSGREGSRVG